MRLQIWHIVLIEFNIIAMLFEYNSQEQYSCMISYSNTSDARISIQDVQCACNWLACLWWSSQLMMIALFPIRIQMTGDDSHGI